MIRQHENRSPQLSAKPSGRKEGSAAPLYRAASPSPKRPTVKPEKGPTFLKVYVIPLFLLNLAVVGWTLVTRNIVAQGPMVSLGYVLIVAVGLRLYLVYLDHCLFRASSVQSGREVQPSMRDQDHHHVSKRGHDARRVSAARGTERRQPGQIRAEVVLI